MNIELPQDASLEALILGTILSTKDAASYCLETLSEDDFTHEPYRILYKALVAMHKQNQELSLENVSLHCRYTEKQISREMLFDLSTVSWSGIDYKTLCAEIANKCTLRKLILAAKDTILCAAEKDAKASDIIARTQNKLLEAQGISGDKTRSYEQIFNNFRQEKSLLEYYDYVSEKVKLGLSPWHGVSSGYTQLDHALGYFQNSCLYYVGARTSMGKTTFMCNLIANISKKYSVGIFSLEMPSQNIVAKILCILSEVNHVRFDDGLLSENERKRLENQHTNLKIMLDDSGALTIEKLASIAKRMRNSGCQIIFIDYLTRIQPNSQKNKSRHNEVDEISKGLQNLAKTLNIPIVCFCQLNRASTNKEPSLVDFRESGSIEEDADACLFIHRPEYYDKYNKPGITEIHIAKNRLRGIIKKIDYQCEYHKSERYTELKKPEF